MSSEDEIFPIEQCSMAEGAVFVGSIERHLDGRGRVYHYDNILLAL